MLVHVEIPGMSLNLQDPLLRLMGIHLWQTGGPLFCLILTDFARGGRRANSTPGPARGNDLSVLGSKQFMMLLILILNNVVDKMLPCGTPCESRKVSDKVDPTHTWNDLSARKLSKNLLICP